MLAVCSTVKFLDNPTLHELHDELKTLAAAMPRIAASTGALAGSTAVTAHAVDLDMRTNVSPKTAKVASMSRNVTKAYGRR
jgi:hypothetical protein